MRVLIVSQYFWPENFRINDLALGLKTRGHEVTVLTGKPNYPDGRFFAGYGFFGKHVEDYEGIKVMRVPLVPRGKGGALALTLNYLSYALFASILGPFLCRDRYDLIFVFQMSPATQGLPAVLLKKLKDIPIMFWVQDLWPETLSATGMVRSRWILRLVAKMVRHIYRNCDRILIQSRTFHSRVEKMGGSSDKILYFPNSAEELYQPLTATPDSPEHALMPKGFRVMFAGNLGAAQDFNTILTAAEKLKDYSDIHWVILGDGRMRSWVEAQIKLRDLAKTVHLLGRYPLEAMPRFFAFADVMLVTLKNEPIFALTIPSKVQSYLACAKPIVAALNGEGARIITEAGAGLACSAENPIDLADGILAMYRMPTQERNALGLRGRAYFEKNFERNMLLDRLDSWMKGLVAEDRQCAS